MQRDLPSRLWVAVWSVALFVPLFVWWYRPAGGGLDITGHQIGRDFINNWIGPQLAFHGRIGTLFDAHGYHTAIGELFGTQLPFHQWGYPLFTLILFWPLALLPYFVALAMWTVLGFGVFAGVVLSQIERADRWPALLLLALAPACLINAIGGQNGFFTAALFIGGVLSIDRRPILAGVLFGLLTLKPHLGLVIPFVLVALSAWRTIAAATITALVVFAISVAAFGIEPTQQFFAVTSVTQAKLLQTFEGFYTYMMMSVLAGGRTFGLSYPSAMALQLAISIPILVASIWAVRRTHDPRLRALVLVCAAPLLTPYAFNYDMTAVAGVLVWGFFGQVPIARHNVIAALNWLAPTMTMYLNLSGFGIMPFALVLLFVAALDRVRSPVLREMPA
jgi:hypothetical protein